MIVNLTQHQATPDQAAQGVVDLPTELRAELSRLLTIDSLPTAEEIEDRCAAVADLPYHLDLDVAPVDVMIGGAPWMMARLEKACRAAGWRPLYAFSVRKSKEEVMSDGSVKKVNVFQHVDFIEA